MVLAEFLEMSKGEGGVEADTLVQRVDVDEGPSRQRQVTFGTLASGPLTTQRTRLGRSRGGHSNENLED